MSEVTIGKWGRNLAIRLPGEIVKALGLRNIIVGWRTAEISPGS
jgi:hypothetical protein